MTRREYGGTLVIQVTNACPFRCPQCYAARGCTHIPVAYAEKQIDRLLRNRMGLVQLTGGEPLLYEGLFELIPFCARRGIYTAVATSGKGLREEHIPLLRDHGVMVHLSLNGSVREVHEITREGFEDTVAALLRLIGEGISCEVNWVASHSNAEDLPRLRERCLEWGVKRIHILRKMPDAHGFLTDTPTPSQLAEIRRLVEEDPDYLCPEGCFHGLSSPCVCEAGTKTVYISCEGTVSPCSALRQFRYGSVGELREREAEWRSSLCVAR